MAVWGRHFHHGGALLGNLLTIAAVGGTWNGKKRNVLIKPSITVSCFEKAVQGLTHSLCPHLEGVMWVLWSTYSSYLCVICGTGIASPHKRNYTAGKKSATASGTIQNQPVGRCITVVGVQRMTLAKTDALPGDLPDVVKRIKSKLKRMQNELTVSSDTLIWSISALSDLLCFIISRHWFRTVPFWTTYPWLSRLQPECQDVEEGGGRIRSWSSCICSLIGRRRPQKMFNKPSKISSPSSC